MELHDRESTVIGPLLYLQATTAGSRFKMYYIKMAIPQHLNTILFSPVFKCHFNTGPFANQTTFWPFDLNESSIQMVTVVVLQETNAKEKSLKNMFLKPSSWRRGEQWSESEQTRTTRILLTDWLVYPKERRRHGYICYNIYYWYESGSFDYWLYYSPSIWKCILWVRQANQRAMCEHI